MAGGAPTYFDKSCPKCGLPSTTMGRIAMNKFGNYLRDTRARKKVKCVLCGSYLFERKSAVAARRPRSTD